MPRFIAAPIRAVPGVLAIAVALASCTSYDIKKDGPLRVREASVRATNVTATAAMYLTLENTDTAAVMIVGAGSMAASAAEFHESMDVQGVSQMKKLDSVPIARGATLTMKPGGLHVMLIDLKVSLAPGDTVPLTIHLGDGRTTVVKAVARDQ